MNVTQIKKMLEGRTSSIKISRTRSLRQEKLEIENQIKNYRQIVAEAFKNKHYILEGHELKIEKVESHPHYYDSDELHYVIMDDKYLTLVEQKARYDKTIEEKYNEVDDEINGLLVDLALHGATPEIAEKVKMLLNKEM